MREKEEFKMNLNETNETNTYETTETPITTTPLHFWRDPINTWRDTSAGMNLFTLHTHVSQKDKVLYQSFVDIITLNPKEKQKHKFFVDEINDCLNDMYVGKEGFVFTTEQVAEIKKIIPSTNVKRSVRYGCYCCWM